MLKKKNKKGALPLIIIAILGIIAVGVIITQTGIIPTGSLISNGYIEVPYFATLSCSPLLGGDKTFTDSTTSKDGEWISDKLPTNAKSWQVSFFYPGAASSRIFDYWICPQKQILNNCQQGQKIISSNSPEQSIGSVSSNNHIFVKVKSDFFGISVSDTKFKVSYTAYGLLRTDATRGGQQYLSETLGCKVPLSDVSWTNRLLNSALGNKPAITRDLQPDEKFNYISGTITRLSDGNMQDNGYCIYSNGQGNIYPIVQLETASGSYNVVDTGQSMKSVECCNGDNLPDKTCVGGKWIQTASAGCSVLNPCEGTEWRADLKEVTQAIRYACVNSQCVAQFKMVECTIDTQCSTNQYCDPNTFTCKQASAVGGKGLTPGESLKEGGWPWYVWVAIVVLAAVLLYFTWPYIKIGINALRTSLKGLPFVGRFIP